MKATLIYSVGALIGSVLASNMQANALFARNIDPGTMDPVRLSVLKCLRTAMPTEPNAPLPTGDFEPAWYANLPEDVKKLLPELYPIQAAVTAAASGVITPTSSAALSPTAIMSSNPGSIDTMIDRSSAMTTSEPLSSPWTSQVTLTSTLHHASTGIATPTNSSGNGTSTKPSTSPSPSSFFSAGAKTRIETLAAVIWFALGACFFLFA